MKKHQNASVGSGLTWNVKIKIGCSLNQNFDFPENAVSAILILTVRLRLW